VPGLGRSEIFTMGQFAHNFSVGSENDGYGVTLGITGGDFKRKLHPFTLWGTYRLVEMDAALGTFADSDLGSGTDVKGWEVTVDYKVTRNFAPYFAYFHQKVIPFRTTSFNRWYMGVNWDF
jgi:predicted porin